jgi:outer membrane protein assembly factor BamB
MFYDSHAPLPTPHRFLKRLVHSIILVLAVFGCALSTTAQMKVSDGTQPGVTRLKWTKPAGVARYRLQIARDEQFNDVLFDGIVSGEEYLVSDLSPGNYYWRLTAADGGRRALRPPTRFEVPATSSATPRVVLSLSSGWLTATGEIASPVVAQLRRAAAPDVVGMNSQGTVYAINSRTGVARWISRYRRNASPGLAPANPPLEFRPTVIDSERTRVVVSFEGGLRALDGLTGKEWWSRELPGRLLGALAGDLDSNPGQEIYVTDATLNQLIALDAGTGAILYQTKLKGSPTGPPVLLQVENARSLLVPLTDDAIEVRSATGEFLRTINAGANLTTAPLVAATTRGILVLVGTTNGLAVFDASGFTPLAGITLATGEYPTGTLSLASSSGSSASDTVIILSNLGRVVAVDLAEVKVKWSVDGFTSAGAATLADVDADGNLDILIPDNRGRANALALGDGSLIWKSDETSGDTTSESLPTRAGRLTTLPLPDGSTIVISNDVAGVGLRAFVLKRGTAAATRK